MGASSTETTQRRRAGSPAYLLIRTETDIEGHLQTVRMWARRARSWIDANPGDPLEFLRRMKFEPAGFHPVDGRALNLIEQINQTWTLVVALLAVRELLRLHPDAGGYKIAPGAHMALPLDVMSESPDLVGAETFAAVHPKNNKKLDRDVAKLATRAERHRYVFFMSPTFPGTERLPQFERDGVQVWSVGAP